MATYQILKSDGTFLTMIEDNEVNNTATSINLFGQGLVNYGTDLDENLVFMLENFSNIISPTNPLVGQLWYNLTESTLNYYDSTLVWLPLVNSEYPKFSGDIIVTDGTNKSEMTTTGQIIVSNVTNGAAQIQFQTALDGPSIADLYVTSNSSGTFLNSSVNFNAYGAISASTFIGFLDPAPECGFGVSAISDDVTYMNMYFENQTNPNVYPFSFGNTGSIYLNGSTPQIILNGSTSSIYFNNGESAYGLIEPWLTDAINVEATGGLYVNGSQVYTTGNFNDSEFLPLAGGTMTGPIVFTDSGETALIIGNSTSTVPSVIHRNDSENYLLLLSEGGTYPNSTWTDARPFFMNLTTGFITNQTGFATSSLTLGSSSWTLTSPISEVAALSYTTNQMLQIDSSGNIYAPVGIYIGSYNNVNVGMVANEGTGLALVVPNSAVTGTEVAMIMDYQGVNVAGPQGISATTFTFKDNLWAFGENNNSGGGIYIFNDGSAVGSFNSDSSLTMNGDITAFSDERLKTNIETSKGLELVKQLRGTSYLKDGKLAHGVIAQEVQKVLPEAIGESQGYLTVNYNHIIPFLIEAIKELSNKIDKLEGKENGF